MLKKVIGSIQDLLSIPHSDMKINLSKDKEHLAIFLSPFTFGFRVWLKRRFQIRLVKKVGSFPMGEVWMDFEKDDKKLSLHYDEPWGWHLFSENDESDSLVRTIYDQLCREAKKQ